MYWPTFLPTLHKIEQSDQLATAALTIQNRSVVPNGEIYLASSTSSCATVGLAFYSDVQVEASDHSIVNGWGS